MLVNCSLSIVIWANCLGDVLCERWTMHILFGLPHKPYLCLASERTLDIRTGPNEETEEKSIWALRIACLCASQFFVNFSHFHFDSSICLTMKGPSAVIALSPARKTIRLAISANFTCSFRIDSIWMKMNFLVIQFQCYIIFWCWPLSWWCGYNIGIGWCCLPFFTNFNIYITFSVVNGTRFGKISLWSHGHWPQDPIFFTVRSH